MLRFEGLRVTAGAHLEACRPDTVFYAGIVGAAGAVLSDPGAPLSSLFVAWLVPTSAWLASLYGGDYFDRELDALTKPHRPVPSGRIQAVTAFRLMVVLIGLGGVVAVLTNPRTLLLAAAATVFGIAYARWLKGHGLWGNVMRGLPTALTLLWGSMVVQPLPEPLLVPLALMFWLHDSGSNLLGALCDRDGDRRGGYLTYPVRRGDDATVRGLVGFTVAWGLLALTWPLLAAAAGRPVALGATSGTLALCLLLHAVVLTRVARSPRPIPRTTCVRAHEIIVLERLLLAGLPILAAGRAGFAVAVVVPSLALTAFARHLMRSRYEPEPAPASRVD